MTADSSDLLATMIQNAKNPYLSAAFEALCDRQDDTSKDDSALNSALETYCRSRNLESILVELLPEVLHLSDSSFGFLAEVRYRGDTPYLHSHAVTDIYKPGFGPHDIVSNLQFHNLDTLNGAILTSRQPVIANNPQTDPRRGGIPFGHAKLQAFMGLPFLLKDQLIGAVALANWPDGYTETEVDFFGPLCRVSALLIAADRSA
jgi:GAF domain-containing protein